MKLTLRNVLRNVIALAFFVCVCIGGTSVCKADAVYTNLDLNTDWIGVPVTEDTVFYTFTVPQDGLVEFGFQSMVNDVYFEVMDQNQTSRISRDEIYGGSENSPKTDERSLALSAGTYLLKVYPYSNNEKNYGNARVKTTYMSYNVTEVEPNSSFTTANTLNSNVPITGAITDNDQSDDFYLFNVPYSGDISINFLSMIKEIRYTFYNPDFTEAGSGYIYSGSETSPKTFTYTGTFAAGNYYLKISHYSGVGRYTITYKNTPVTSVSMAASVSLSVNDTYSLNPTIAPEDAVNKTLNYVSSDTTIASVSSDGTVRANKAGIVTITATTTDGTNISAVTKVIVLPSKVTGLKVSTAAPTSLKLTWTAISGADGYRVFLYNSSKKKFVKYKDVKANSVTIKKLKAETKYKIKVQAYVKDGSDYQFGTVSEILSTYTAPKKLSATKITSTKVTSSDAFGKSVSVKWKKVSGATGYLVYKKNSAGDWMLDKRTESTSAQIYLSKGYTYSIKVIPYRTKNGLTTNGKESKAVKKKG